jgi:hypothetical protein
VPQLLQITICLEVIEEGDDFRSLNGSMPLYLFLVDSIRTLLVGSFKLRKAPTSELDLPAVIRHSYLRSPRNAGWYRLPGDGKQTTPRQPCP